MALCEVEPNEAHRLIFGLKGPRSCPTLGCPLRTPTGPATLEACRTASDHIVGSSLGRTCCRFPGSMRIVEVALDASASVSVLPV